MLGAGRLPPCSTCSASLTARAALRGRSSRLRQVPQKELATPRLGGSNNAATGAFFCWPARHNDRSRAARAAASPMGLNDTSGMVRAEYHPGTSEDG
jgi:hypothetical protein